MGLLILEPEKPHVHRLCLFGLYTWVYYSGCCCVVNLYCDVLGCGWCISSRMLQISTPLRELSYDIGEALAADDIDMTAFLIISARIWIAPLLRGAELSTFSDKKNRLPALLHALDSLQYHILLWTASTSTRITTLLLRYVTTAGSVMRSIIEGLFHLLHCCLLWWLGLLSCKCLNGVSIVTFTPWVYQLNLPVTVTVTVCAASDLLLLHLANHYAQHIALLHHIWARGYVDKASAAVWVAYGFSTPNCLSAFIPS